MESPSCSQDSQARRPSSLILYSRSKGTKSREEMESPPSSPTSLVVSSPRRTLSLLRERRSSTFSSDQEERKSTAAMAGFADEHGPKPSEVYGFVGSITTVISTVIFFVWAYTPESWLHSLGITYYPSKHWALAVPTFFMVTIVLVIAFYIGLNFMVTPPPTSFDTMFEMESPSCSQDSQARRPSSLILYSRSKGTKSREEMESPPSSPTSLVVSSPRRTLSLLRERRSSTFPSDQEERKSPAAMAGFADEQGPKPSEVYGFVGSITTVISTVIFFVWAYTPEPWLHSLGITYYPSKSVQFLHLV